MSSLSTKNDKVLVTGIFALGLVAGGAFALVTDISAIALMAVFAVIFALSQYRRE